MPSPDLGVIFSHVDSAKEGISWVIGIKHSEHKDLFYIMPIDMFWMIGTWDIASGDNSYDAIRCGRGNWIEISVFDNWLKTGKISCDGDKLSSEVILEIHKKVGELIGSGPSNYIEEVDCSPDYQDHMETVMLATLAIEKSIHEIALYQ